MSVANLFECTVAYEKMMENGMQKKVSEPYIVKAYSFTEAEAVITDFIKPYITGEFSIKSIKRCKCNEIVEDANGDRYFNAIISMITLDEKSGKEKKTRVPLVVQANDMDGALDNLKKHMSGSMADYEVAKLEESKIMDVVLDVNVSVKTV